MKMKATVGKETTNKLGKKTKKLLFAYVVLMIFVVIVIGSFLNGSQERH
jgi:hypothetical protein